MSLQKSIKKNKKFFWCLLLVIPGLAIYFGLPDKNTHGKKIQVADSLSEARTLNKEDTLNKAKTLRRADASNKKIVAHKNKREDPILGDYASFIRKNGNFDVQATIDKLEELHVNTYYYLFGSSKLYWNILRKEFLPAAQKAGIDVVVYLTPPSGQNNPPFGRDYIAWAQAIAQLSLQYPNLTGWTIDDFSLSSNLDFFNPNYVKKMTQAGKKINPELTFRPVVYYGSANNPSFAQNYAPYIDGIIFPYTKLHNLKPLPDELDRITKLYPPKTVVLMVYVTKLGSYAFPSSTSFVRQALQIGLNYNKNGGLAGVTTYKLPKVPHKTPCTYALNFAVAPHTPTKANSYAEASQKVQLDANTKSYRISFLQQNSRSNGPKGYHFKQLLVDGNIAWSKDVATSANGMVSLDLTPYLQGKKSAPIAFRLYEKKGVGNYNVTVDIGNVQGHGFNIVNGDSTNSGWTFSSTSNVAGLECDPQWQRHTFNAVKNLYGSWRKH